MDDRLGAEPGHRDGRYAGLVHDHYGGADDHGRQSMAPGLQSGWRAPRLGGTSVFMRILMSSTRSTLMGVDLVPMKLALDHNDLDALNAYLAGLPQRSKNKL